MAEDQVIRAVGSSSRIRTNLKCGREKYEKEKAWKQARGIVDESDEESGDEDREEESGSEETSSDEGESKAKGVEALIEIQNPNRIQKAKPNKRAELTTQGASGGGGGPSTAEPEVQLSRREREEIEKQRAKETYDRLHAEGKTEQARADLARLALIRQQREDAQRKKDAEKQQREGAAKSAAASKTAATKSTLASINSSSNSTSGDQSSSGAKKKPSSGRK